MSKSAIYVANTTTQEVPVDGLINPGNTVRRFGCNIRQINDSINLSGVGYYDLDASFTVAPTAEGEVTITALRDGTVIPGATATETAAAAGDSVNLSISALVREYCPCCDSSSTVTFVLSGVASSITNVSIVIKKL